MNRLLRIIMFVLIVAAIKGFAEEAAPAKTDPTCACKIVDMSVDPLIGKNVAVSWWNQDKTQGKRLILSSSLNLNINQDYNDGRVTYSNTESIATGEFDWCIKRVAHKSIDGLYWYKGRGIALSVNASENPYNSNVTVTNAALGFTVPLGIEYFMLKSAPSFSVSLEARPTLSLSFRGPADATTNSSRYTYSVALSVTPQLFVSYYFE